MRADAAAIDALLPQTQCQRCDYPDCQAYAEAIASAEAAINQCPPGGEATLKALAELLDLPMSPIDPARGGFGAASTVAVVDEPLCIGCVKCIEVCPVDAIIGAAKQMHTVVSELCSGCELCVPVCPTDCIDMRPRPADQDPTLLAGNWRHDHQRRDARRAPPPPPAPLTVQAGTFDIAAALARAQTQPRPRVDEQQDRRVDEVPDENRMPLTRAQVTELYRRLAEDNPEPETELVYKSPFELLVAVVLSAQATDVSVNKATKPLYAVANTPAAILKLGEEGLREYIRTIGLYQTKAKNVIKLCSQLLELHGGKVPDDRDALEALPGVGRKTANVVLNVVFGHPTIAVDTHIFRIANRTGMAPGKSPDAISERLEKITPKLYLLHAHHWLILHGRYVCKARLPECWHCKIRDLCRYKPKSEDPSVTLPRAP